MPDKDALLAEAKRRGLLQTDDSALMAEAKARGLLKTAPDAFDQAVSKPEKPSTLVGVGRGIADLTEGLEQARLRVSDAITGGNERQSYTRLKDTENAAYERGRGADNRLPQTVAGNEVIAAYKPGNAAGMDWARLGGNALSMASPLAGGASMGARVLSNAVQGGVASGMMFTPEGGSAAGQAALGASFGGAVPLAGTGVRKMAGQAGKALGIEAPRAMPNLTGDLQIRLERQGLDWNKLTDDVQKSLLADAEAALSTGGKLDDAALARKAVIESVGAQPTKASVTRQPRDWQTEKNLRGVQGAGDGIVERESSNAKSMIDYLSRIRQATGGTAQTSMEASESTIGALKQLDDARGVVVDRAYAIPKDHLGRAAPMDAKGFSDAANISLDEKMLGSYLPQEVRSILNDVATGKIPLTVNSAVQIDRTLSAAQRSAGNGSPQSLAIGQVRDALNKAKIADNVGEDAKAAFDQARGIARQRFQTLENPATGAAVDDVAPDKFLQKYILGADVRDLRTTYADLRKIPEGRQAIADIKGHVLDGLLMKATGATAADDVIGKPFSGVKFSKALDAIPPEKLHQLFSPSELESLRTLQKASKFLTEEVPFSDVNHSKTAAAMANLLQKIGATPLLGQIVSPIIGAGKIGMDWVKDAETRKAVAEALVGRAGQPGKPQLPPMTELEKRLPYGAGAAAYQTNQEK